MLSALIPSAHSYPAMLLAEQLVHQRCVHPGPLVLRTAPLKFPTPTTDRDRTVSDDVRAQIGPEGRAICGLSGGVDSAVAAALVEGALLNKALAMTL